MSAKKSVVNRCTNPIMGVLLVVAQFLNLTSLADTAYADTGSLVQGNTTSNTSPGDNQPNYSTVGATVVLRDSSGNILGQTVTDNNSHFTLTNVPNGYSYLLEVDPPSDNPGNLLPYFMNLDVMGDTDLNQTQHNRLLTLYSQTSRPSQVLFDGITLYNGSMPNPQQWVGLSVGNGTYGQAMNIDGMSGGQNVYSSHFSVSLPPGDGYALYQPSTLGFLVVDRGIINMRPTMSLTRDSYYVFNIDRSDRATPHTIKVVDQCGNPVPDVGIRGYRLATLTLRDHTVTDTVYDFSLANTDSNGESPIQTQTQGYLTNNNATLNLRLSYYDPASNSINNLLDTVIGDPLPSVSVVSVNLPECIEDSTPPAITPHLSQNPDSNGWNNAPVTLSWNVVDNGSSVTSQTGCDTVTVTPATSGTYTCTATSRGGTSSQSIAVNVDTVPPVILGTPSPAPNGNGWNNSATTISWNVTARSPIKNKTGCDTITVNAEGQGMTYDCIATSTGGTSRYSVAVSIDKTVPKVSTPTVTGGLTLPLFGNVFVGNTGTVSANISDNLSGVAGAEYYIDSDPGRGHGTPMLMSSGKASASLDTSKLSPGAHNLYVRDYDNADNWSASSTPVVVTVL